MLGRGARRFWTGVAMLGLAVASVAHAATGQGTARLRVLDAEGRPVVEASVEATSTDLQGTRRAVSSPRGEVLLAALPPGDYTAEIRKAGFRDARVRFAVRQGTTREVEVVLEVAGVDEELEVMSPAPIVDPATPTVAEHLDLAALAALPVTRDYRGFAQLVAGVNVVPNSDGIELRWEPASKAGNFYQDRGGALGSRDNQYYLDGFQLTDMGGGDGQLRFNAEAIREQEVVTSGVPADLSGGAGYVVNLATRSGGPRFHGTASFYLQDPSWTSSYETDDSRLRRPREDKWDAGLTFGGPLVAERLWFYLAGQQREASDDVELSTSASPTPRTETYAARQQSLLGKLTWSPGEADTVTGLFLGEWRETSGTRDVNTPPNRYLLYEQEPQTGQLAWQHRFGARALAEARWTEHEQRSAGEPAAAGLGPTNTLLYPPGVSVPAYQRDLGSSGDPGVVTLRKRQGDLAATLYLDGLGSHAVKLGVTDQRWEEEVATESRFGFSLTSLAPSLAGLSWAAARELNLLPPSEYDAIFRALVANPGSSAFRAADADGDGVVTEGEFAGMRFTSRTGNRDGVNFLRFRTVSAGVSDPYQTNLAFYLQDEWRIGRVAVLAGVRAEERGYYASDDSTILEVDPAWYPRAGVAWDLRGDGRQRLSLAWGIYPDPLRSSMIRFAGNLTGSVFADEVFLGDGWFSYRERGASQLRREAGFAPNMENEEEEELQLTYGVNFAGVWGFLAQLYRREDRNLIEDYDPGLYFNPAAAGPLALTPGDFGYPPSGPTDVSYFLANLVGGRRVTEGLDLALTRRLRNGWSATLQYSWKDAHGNSNSDGAADLQGDFLDLDPRQPYMDGPLPGTIENQVKLFGVWQTPLRLEIGALLYWNDGAVFTEAIRFRPTGSNILYNYQRPGGSYVRSGQEKHPGYTTLDLRLRYPIAFGDTSVDLVVDVFNALDEQGTLRVEESHNGAEFTTYREPRLLLDPRRWQAGVRVGWR